MEIPQTVNQYVEKIIQEDVVLTQEKPVEIGQIQTVELTTQVPKPVWQPIEKPVPQIQIQGHEMIEQVVVTTRQEQPVEVPVPEMHELRVQVANIQHAGREVLRNPKTTHVVVKEEVVPVELKREKAQYVPQMQMIELIKEEPQITCKQVQKSIPKYEMKYINNVITVGPKYMEHVHDLEIDEEVVVTDYKADGRIIEEDYKFKEVIGPAGNVKWEESDTVKEFIDGKWVIRHREHESGKEFKEHDFGGTKGIIGGGYMPGTLTGGTTGGYVSGGTLIGGTTGGYVSGGTLTGGTTGGYVTGGRVIGGATGGYVTGGTVIGGAASSAFNALDRNSDGVITRAEFNSAVRPTTVYR